MTKYVSTSINADYFKKCVFGYLSETTHSNQSENAFWQFVKTLTFDNGKISRDCPFFKAMKEYADKNPMTKTALIWQLFFENADDLFVKEIILYLMEEKEKRQDDRKKRKTDSYATTLDNFNNYVRQIKFKLKQNHLSDDLITQFDEMQTEWQEKVKSRMSEYKENDIPLDEGFYYFLFELKTTVREMAAKISSYADTVEVSV